MAITTIDSLRKRKDKLAYAANQIAILDKSKEKITSFEDNLAPLGLFPLKPTTLDILQVNVGYMCNQTCSHCHVDAGPDRKEIMTVETMQHCLDAIDQSNIKTVDITGGAPEMNPDFLWFVEELSKRKLEIIVRSNLTILEVNSRFKTYPAFFKKHGVTVIASLPCYTRENTDKQRGNGVFDMSIRALQALNKEGYGKENSGLELHLVFNPGGASLPPSQETLESDYKRNLKEDFDIEFNKLYTITNLPISRFLDYLLAANKYDQYMDLLVNSFNPTAAEGVMCRNTISVDWLGNLFDCDFNQMLELPLSKEAPQHIRDFNNTSLESREIVLNQHCYGCTAGAGSSCQGSILN